MLKAQHASMAQQASNNLASIRNTEIQYYVGFFNNIGIQSAFIAGYQLSTISQVVVGTNSIYFAYCYWISSVISICCSLECLLVSLYLVVFGQGLALRGPPGSMIKAINAFIYYQHHILFSFTMNIVFLGLSTIFQYYVFMTLLGAHICCVITIIGMLIWHKYCLKVFNRFKFANESIDWTKRDDDIHEQRNSQGEIDDDPTHRYEKNSTQLINEAHAKKSDASWRKKVFSKLLFSNGGARKKNDPEPEMDYSTNPMSGSSIHDIHQSSTNPVFRRSSNTRPEDANFDNILFHGTLDVRTLNTATNPTSNWMRKYIIILSNGTFMTYNSRSDYENNHMNSLCKTIKPFDVPTQTKIPYTTPSEDRREALNIIIMSTDKKSSFNGLEFRFFTVDDSETCFKIISKLHDVVEEYDEDSSRTVLSDNSMV